jgi:hypothetical protein
MRPGDSNSHGPTDHKALNLVRDLLVLSYRHRNTHSIQDLDDLDLVDRAFVVTVMSHGTVDGIA